MPEVQRLTPEDLEKEDPWAWAASTPEPEPDTEPARRHTPEEAKAHAVTLVDEGMEAETAAVAMTSFLSGAVQHMEETLDPSLLVAAVASIQRARAELRQVEELAARALGRQARETPHLKTGKLDGGTWEVRGGTTRKTWDHAAWKADVRRAIVEELGLEGLVVLDPATGEEVPLDLKKTAYSILELGQAVHGSAPPKVTALKPLGLEVVDYCEQYPGPFTITITTDAEASGEDTSNA